jgi:hypothetical protein
MNVPFAKNKCICDLSVSHIDGELFRNVGVGGVVWKHELDVLRQVSNRNHVLKNHRATDARVCPIISAKFSLLRLEYGIFILANSTLS